jgi:hypothetical protein
MGLASAGLVLMLLGYALLEHRWARPAEEADPPWEEMHRLAENDPAGKKLADEARAIEERRQTEPLYRRAGVVAIYAGLLLFAAAGIRMYRHQPPAAAEGDEENLLG